MKFAHYNVFLSFNFKTNKIYLLWKLFPVIPSILSYARFKYPEREMRYLRHARYVRIRPATLPNYIWVEYLLAKGLEVWCTNNSNDLNETLQAVT